jgi:hypothetical protein
MGEQRLPAEVFPSFQLSPTHGRAFSDGRWLEGYSLNLPLFPTNATLYTCPAGKKAVLGQCAVVAYTATGTTVSVYCVPSAGTASGANRFISGAIAGDGQVNYNVGIPLNAGDSIQASASVVNLLACYCSIWEFPASEPITSFYQALVANTVTTLYTAPAGKSAHIAYSIVAGGYGGTIYNDVQTANATFKTYIKPSGAAAYQISQIDNIPVSNTKQMDAVMWPTLGPGDAWQALSTAVQGGGNSGGMSVWGIVTELDAA